MTSPWFRYSAKVQIVTLTILEDSFHVQAVRSTSLVVRASSQLIRKLASTVIIHNAWTAFTYGIWKSNQSFIRNSLLETCYTHYVNRNSILFLLSYRQMMSCYGLGFEVPRRKTKSRLVSRKTRTWPTWADLYTHKMSVSFFLFFLLGSSYLVLRQKIDYRL